MSGRNYSWRLFDITGALFQELRPRQWYKQSVMIISIVFSRNLLDFVAWLNLSLGIFAFTAIAGGLYIFNDILDLEADRQHPRKQYRPIASGQISPTLAAVFATGIGFVGLATTSILGPLFTGIILLYILQNVIYSLFLKRVMFVEAIVVANGFVLRAIAGVFAIDVVLSPWLILTTFLFALMLVVGKRIHEMEINTSNETRDVLDNYDEGQLNQLLVLLMSALLMSYSLYTFFTMDLTMMMTIPFAFYGIFRYHYLLQTSDVAGQPEYLLTDIPTVINLILWSIVVVAVLYSIPQ